MAFESSDVEDKDDPARVVASGSTMRVYYHELGQKRVAATLAQLRERLSHRSQSADEARRKGIWEQRVTLHCADISVGEFVARLQQLIRFPIVVDTRTLGDASLSLESKVTCDATDISLRSLLFHVLRPMPQSLAAILDDDELVVTTVERANEERTFRIYDVRGLAPAHPLPLYDLPLLVRRFLGDEESWSEIVLDDRFPDRAQLLAGLLCVYHTEEVHADIEPFLRHIRRAGAFRPADVPLTRQEAREALLRWQLQQNVTVSPRHFSLKSLLAWLRDRSGLSVLPDTRRLEDASVDLKADIILEIHDEPLQQGLERALAPLHLGLYVDHEMVVVTTLESLNSSFQIEVFPSWKMLPRETSDHDLLRRLLSFFSQAGEEGADVGWIEDGNKLLVRSGYLFIKHNPGMPRLNFAGLARDDDLSPDFDKAATLAEQRWRALQRGTKHPDRPARRSRINP